MKFQLLFRRANSFNLDKLVSFDAAMDELERQLRDKATEIHETALLGKQLLQQQESLYAKVASLAPADYSPASPASPASPGAAPAALDTLQDDLAQLHSTSPTSPAQLRRSRNTNNAQRTSNDIELATSIGTSLLAEVRRLQALLLEKEAILRDEQLNKEAALSACESEKRSKERGEQLSGTLYAALATPAPLQLLIPASTTQRNSRKNSGPKNSSLKSFAPLLRLSKLNQPSPNSSSRDRARTSSPPRTRMKCKRPKSIG